jgi:hypothetical protein
MCIKLLGFLPQEIFSNFLLDASRLMQARHQANAKGRQGGEQRQNFARLTLAANCFAD